MRLICIVVFFISSNLRAQISNNSEDIAVLARSYRDSISLRWAPTTFPIWKLGNQSGYVVERYTLMRNKKMLNTPEKKTLTNVPLKPIEEAKWEAIVKTDKYAAVAAQALFGESFELDIRQSDVFQVVNKVTENEQRFAFALFSADMSSAVARVSGLLFTDRQTKYDERYLYRIVIYTNADTLRGSIFSEPEFIIPLPRPENLNVTFQEKTAMLQWNKMSVNNIYTAYRIEKSLDGSKFFSVSEIPITTFSSSLDHDSPYEYYTDSISDITKNHSYRVIGITPFGELSPPSQAVSGKSMIHVDDVPTIFDGKSVDNKSAQIQWEFPEESNKSIQGFDVERSLTANGPFQKVSHQSSMVRTYIDPSPRQINYYRVNALQADGQGLISPTYLVQLVDSIPPVAPTDLKATVNEFGHVSLMWRTNSEEDIYGYRVYRANFTTEESFQITTEPISQSNYVDTIDLKTLDEYVYYTVMAIDRSQNHSELSKQLRVPVPDKIKPQPPLFLPVRSDQDGVHLLWEKSVSSDVVQYDVYRQRSSEQEWLRVKTVSALQDSVYQYTDTTATIGGRTNLYTVIAIDESGLESDPANVMRAGRIDFGVHSAVKWKMPVIDRTNAQVILNWEYDQSGIEGFRIYKAKGNSSPTLYHVIPFDQRQFHDKQLGVGEEYSYRIIAIFKNGSKSALSDLITVNY